MLHQAIWVAGPLFGFQLKLLLFTGVKGHYHQYSKNKTVISQF